MRLVFFAIGLALACTLASCDIRSIRSEAELCCSKAGVTTCLDITAVGRIPAYLADEKHYTCESDNFGPVKCELTVRTSTVGW